MKTCDCNKEPFFLYAKSYFQTYKEILENLAKNNLCKNKKKFFFESSEKYWFFDSKEISEKLKVE